MSRKEGPQARSQTRILSKPQWATQPDDSKAALRPAAVCLPDKQTLYHCATFLACQQVRNVKPNYTNVWRRTLASLFFFFSHFCWNPVDWVSANWSCEIPLKGWWKEGVTNLGWPISAVSVSIQWIQFKALIQNDFKQEFSVNMWSYWHIIDALEVNRAV